MARQSSSFLRSSFLEKNSAHGLRYAPLTHKRSYRPNSSERLLTGFFGSRFTNSRFFLEQPLFFLEQPPVVAVGVRPRDAPGAACLRSHGPVADVMESGAVIPSGQVLIAPSIPARHDGLSNWEFRRTGRPCVVPAML